MSPFCVSFQVRGCKLARRVRVRATVLAPFIQRQHKLHQLIPVRRRRGQVLSQAPQNAPHDFHLIQDVVVLHFAVLFEGASHSRSRAATSSILSTSPTPRPSGTATISTSRFVTSPHCSPKGPFSVP